MKERPKSFQPIGLNTRGEWVNLNHTCGKCRGPMPLPEMNKKHCPQCGTFCHVPSEQELAEADERAKKECSKCGYKNLRGAIFCISCGTKL